MTKIIIDTDEGELFGGDLEVSFLCDVDDEAIPYEPGDEYTPPEGGYIQINGFTFHMTVHNTEGKNDLLGSFMNYENLSEEKKKKINSWVAIWLQNYYDDKDLCDLLDIRDEW